MFSLFKNGISNCIPERKISIEALVKLIRSNDIETIRAIRNLDQQAPDYDAAKKKLKQRLTYITPNCTVSYRDDDHITEFSGYMYFDIDHVEDPREYKSKLIEEYKEYISMICLSCSGTGLSIFTKIENEITPSNFRSIREYICRHVFKDLNLDPKTTVKTNAWFISYDPYCYHDPCSVIEVPEDHIRDENKEILEGTFGNIINPPTDILPNGPFDFDTIPISEVMQRLKFRTEVDVEGRIFDMKPVEYCEVHLHKDYRIPAGDKMKIFGQIIHNLVYLNPDVDPNYIFSYISYLNNSRTVAGTEAKYSELKRFFVWVYYEIKRTGILCPTTRIKWFHCRPNTISPLERQKLSRKMTAILKVHDSINKVLWARELIEILKRESTFDNISVEGIIILPNVLSGKVTQKEVCTLINHIALKHSTKGISINTVKKYWHSDPIDLEDIVRQENERIHVTYISKKVEREYDVCEPPVQLKEQSVVINEANIGNDLPDVHCWHVNEREDETEEAVYERIHIGEEWDRQYKKKRPSTDL